MAMPWEEADQVVDGPTPAPWEAFDLPVAEAPAFDPYGDGYDMQTAVAAGLQPDATGHWPSRDPRTGMLLKGRNHPTWHLTEQGEREAGMEVYEQDGRFYSRPRMPSLTERFMANLGEGFWNSSTGAAIKHFESGREDLETATELSVALAEAELAGSERGLPTINIGGRKMRNPFAGVPVGALREQAERLSEQGLARRDPFLEKERARRAAYEAMPDFYEEEGMAKVPAFVAALAGQLLGGAPAVENLVPVSRGKTLWETIRRGGMAAGGTNLAIDPGLQQQDIELGLQDQYDPVRTAVSTVAGAGVGGAINVAPHIPSAIRERRAQRAAAAAQQPEPAPIDPEAIVRDRTVAPQMDLQEQIAAATGAPLMPDAPHERAQVLREQQSQRAQLAQALNELFGPVVGNEEVVYPQLARTPASVEQRARMALEEIGESPESIATAFERAYAQPDVEATMLQRDIDQRPARDQYAQRQFELAERQRQRKQAGQDEAALQGQPRDLRDAEAAGTTTAEGTAATTPETFTFFDAKVRNGQMVGGEQVEVVQTGLRMKDAKGKEVDATVVRFVDREGQPEMPVPSDRLTEYSRPANPRFAQDVQSRVYEPPRGVGLGSEQPQPRAAAQRITTEPSPEFIPGRRMDAEPEGPRAPREGRDVTDLAFDRVTDGTAARARDGQQPTQQPRQSVQQLEPPPSQAAPRRPTVINDADDEAPIFRGEVDEAEADSLARWEAERDARFREEIADELRGMAKGAGWQEVGGRLIRDADGNAVDRTKWIGEEWFASMRAGLGRKGLSAPEAIQRAVEKYLAGEKLNANERRTVGWMVDELSALREQAEFAGLRMDEAYAADIGLQEAGAQRTAQNLYDVDYLTRLDEATLERLAIQHPDDTDAFMRAAKEAIDAQQREAGDAAPTRPSGEGGETSARPDLDLEQPTPEGLRARDAEQQRAEAQQRRVDDAPPPEDFTLTGSDRPADQAAARGQNELFDNRPENPPERPQPKGMTLEEAKAYLEQANRERPLGRSWDDIERMQGGKLNRNGSGGTFYSGFPLDKMAEAVAGAFKWATGAGQWKQSMADFIGSIRSATAAQKPAEKLGNPVGRFFNAAFNTASGDVRAAVRAAGNSKTANEILDHFHVEAGKAGAQGETFGAAVLAHTNREMLRVHKAIGKYASDKEAMKQIANLVRNPRSIRPGNPIHDAAREIRKVLDDALTYMREAGVDVGEVKDGYYPREFSMTDVMRDPQGFIEAAAQAYRENGIAPSEAMKLAKELHDTVLFGQTDSMFKPEKSNVHSPFLKGRVFGKSVDDPNHPLNKFLLSDPALSLPIYLQRVARRAEIARRFGDNFSKWDELMEKVTAEGGGAAIEKLKDYVTLAAGMKRPGVSSGALRMSSIMRTWGALMFLEKATLSSLTEFITPAIRAGNVMDVGRSLKTTIAHLFKTASAAERKALAEDLGLIAEGMHDALNAARFAGGDPVSLAEARILDRYFRRTGLTQWTDATRVGSMDVGRVFIRRLSKQMQGNSKLAERHLAELGIPRERAKAFADFVVKANDGMPGISDLQGPMGDMYRKAIRRFVSQSIMNPDATTKPGWMSSPLGSIVGQLQSFNYAFYENVLKRTARLAKEAWVNDADYTMMERAKLVAPAAMLPLLIGAAYAIGEVRDSVLGDPEHRKRETETDRWIKAASRGMPIAPIDPLVNIVSQARYQTSSVAVAAGPVIGKAGYGLDALIGVTANNNIKTNTAERRAAKAAYDLFIEPTVNLALTGVPLVPASLVTQAVGSGTVRDKFVDAAAGEKKKRGGRGGR